MKEVMVEHEYNGQRYRRIIKFEGDLGALKAAILKVYDDVLVTQIAKATGKSREDVRDLAKQGALDSFLYISAFNLKYGEFVQILNPADIIEGMKLAFKVLNPAGEKKGSTKKKITLDDEDRTFDIALGIDGLNIHVRVTKGDHDHKFFPFWFKEVDLSPAIAARLPGNCRMWCPVYSQGQGYVQIGGALNGPNRHGVNTGGMRSLTQPSDHDPTIITFVSSPNGEEKARICFPYLENEKAYMAYVKTTGEVVATTDPDDKELNCDFILERCKSAQGYGMYWKIIPAEANGAACNISVTTKKGNLDLPKQNLIGVTQENTLVCREHEVSDYFINPACLFAINVISSQPV